MAQLNCWEHGSGLIQPPSPGSWGCSGVCPKLVLDLFLWMSMNNSMPDFTVHWNQHKLTCPFRNKHYIFIPGRSPDQIFIIYGLIQSRKHQRRYSKLKEVLNSILQRGKIALLLEQNCEGSVVDQWSIWGDVWHFKSWIDERLATSHWWGKETEAWEAGRQRDRADCQSPDSSSGVPFWRWFWWHVLSSLNQHLQMKCSLEHFKPAVLMGFLWSH